MEPGELTADQKQRIDQAIAAAETATGVQWCVILGIRSSEDPRREAERAFHKADMHGRPSVLIMVTPSARTLEIVVAHELRDRITNQMCEEVVRLMTGVFIEDDVTSGIERGIALLAERAGSLTTDVPPPTEDLPNVVDLED